MTREEITRIAERMAAAWNARDLEAFLSFLAEDVVWDDPAMPTPARGRDAVKRFGESVLVAFPDFHYAIRGPICVAADGSLCAVPWKITATGSGRLEPPGFAPTHRHVEFDGVDLLEFGGGRVRKIETFFNPLLPAEQLLDFRLRPVPGGIRERLLVWVQRLRAAWLRRTRR